MARSRPRLPDSIGRSMWYEVVGLRVQAARHISGNVTYIAIDCSILLVKPIPQQRYHPTAVHQESGISLKSLCSHSAPAIALAAGSCYTVVRPLPSAVKEREEHEHAGHSGATVHPAANQTPPTADSPRLGSPSPPGGRSATQAQGRCVPWPGVSLVGRRHANGQHRQRGGHRA